MYESVTPMTAIERTAYPRFKQILSAKDHAEVYTPTPQERLVAHRSTKGRQGFTPLLFLAHLDVEYLSLVHGTGGCVHQVSEGVIGRPLYTASPNLG